MRMHCSSDKSGCKARCFKMALLMIVGIAAVGWLVMLLWNWLMPTLFMGVQQIGYWQALGILLLSKILFGSCHGHGHCKSRHQHWESLTPEEREQMKGHFKSRWGSWCRSDKTEDKTESTSATHVE
jgi:hypothetical protein